jgi:hypothetical protein
MSCDCCHRKPHTGSPQCLRKKILLFLHQKMSGMAWWMQWKSTMWTGSQLWGDCPNWYQDYSPWGGILLSHIIGLLTHAFITSTQSKHIPRTLKVSMLLRRELLVPLQAHSEVKKEVQWIQFHLWCQRYSLAMTMTMTTQQMSYWSIWVHVPMMIWRTVSSMSWQS